MKFFKWFLIVFVVLLIQTQLSSLLYGMSFTALVVFFFAITVTEGELYKEYATVKPELLSAVFGMCVGIAEDFVTDTPLGINMCSKGIIGFFTSFLSIDVFFRVTTFSCMLTVAIFSILDNLFYVFVLNITQKISINPLNFMATSMLHATISSIIAYFFAVEDYKRYV